jgi:hypothetical protein
LFGPFRLQHLAQAMGMRVRERSGFYFEAVIPITAADTLNQITADCERPWLPLFDDVAKFVEHQPRILKEIFTTAPQINPSPPCRGDGTPVQSHE